MPAAAPARPTATVTPPDVCPRCQGKRWLVRDVAPGDPDFSRLVACSCWQQERARLLERVSGLDGEMLQTSLTTTAALPGVAGFQEALDTARTLIDRPAWFYTLWGAYGVGKTHLLSAIVNDARRAGHVAVYTTMANLLEHLRRTFRPGAELDGDELWDRVMSADVLAVDELDRFNPTGWAQERFFMLIDERYRKGQTRLTCFATNGSIAALPGYLESRMTDRRCATFEIIGPDIRPLRS